MKLFPKTFCYTLSIMVAITLIGHGLIYFLLPVFYTHEKESLADSIGKEMIERIQESSTWTEEKVLEQYAKKNKAFIALACGEKQYIYGSIYIEDALEGNGKEYSFAAMPADPGAGARKGVTNTEQSIEEAIPYLSTQFVKKEFSFQNSEGTDCFLRVFITLQSVNEAKGVVLQILPITLIICFIISVVVALLYSRRISRPIKKISFATEQMKQLERTALCEVRTKDEIGQLAQNVNSLYQELLISMDNLHAEILHVSEVEQSKIDFMRAASHELKTPVTAVCTMLDSMILGVGKFGDTETYLPICKEMMLQLSAMIQEVLDASKLSSQPEEASVETELPVFLKKICDSYLFIAKSRGIQIEIDIEKAGKAALPQKAVQRAVSNIISNAVKYTVQGGKVSIHCAGGKLVVKNECPPIPDEDLKHLFEAFYRPDYSRSRETGGSGLGLYIIKTIFERYGFPYNMANTGHGVTFTVDFDK